MRGSKVSLGRRKFHQNWQLKVTCEREYFTTVNGNLSFRSIRIRIKLLVTQHFRKSRFPLYSNMIDASHFGLDWLHGLISRYFDVYEIGEDVVPLIGTVHDQTANHVKRPKSSESPVPPGIFLGDRGRPRYMISREQVEFLLEHCFSVVDIVSLLSVGVRTLERRFSEFSLSAR